MLTARTRTTTGLTKPFGFVLDFVGIFEKLERALAFDSDVVASSIQNIDVLQNALRDADGRARGQVPAADARWDDKAKERAVEFFRGSEEKTAFYGFFTNLQNLYDILSPDAFLRPYVEDYQALAGLYGLLKSAESAYVDKELTRKTRALLREAASTYSVETPEVIHALGPDELAALKSSGAGDTTKVLNLRKLLAQTVRVEGMAKPFLRSIGERAEDLAQRYQDRHMETQQALAAFEQLALEYVEADAERERLGLDANAYGIYVELKRLKPDLDPAQAMAVNELFGQFPDYVWNEQRRTRLRTDLYKVLRPVLGTNGMVGAVNTILTLQRV